MSSSPKPCQVQPSQLFCKNLICILWFLMNLVCTIHFSTNYGSWVLTISFLLRIKKTLGYSSNLLQKSCLHIMIFVKRFVSINNTSLEIAKKMFITLIYSFIFDKYFTNYSSNHFFFLYFKDLLIHGFCNSFMPFYSKHTQFFIEF